MTTPVVSVRKVCKTFTQQGTFPWSPSREVHAVVDVDLEVAPGEVVALVGQSGSGKTTLSRCILGLESITSGEILLEGRPWSSLDERHRRLSGAPTSTSPRTPCRRSTPSRRPSST